jgi:hypothetical protein
MVGLVLINVEKYLGKANYFFRYVGRFFVGPLDFG